MRDERSSTSSKSNVIKNGDLPIDAPRVDCPVRVHPYGESEVVSLVHRVVGVKEVAMSNKMAVGETIKLISEVLKLSRAIGANQTKEKR